MFPFYPFYWENCLTSFIIKWCYHFSDVVCGKAKDDVALQKKDNISLDVQKVSSATGKTDVEMSGASGTSAKGRGTR